MKIFFTVLSLVPTLGWAHIEDGMWKGQMDNGQDCQMQVMQNYFESNTPHPLNERIKVSINGEEFVLRHPPVISLKDKSAYFNHDMFESIVATSKGGKALLVTMNHSAGAEGPTEFNIINHEYRANVREVSSCKSLQFVK